MWETELLKRKVKIGYHVFFSTLNVSPSNSIRRSPLASPLFHCFNHIPSMIDRWFYTLFSKSIDLMKSQFIIISRTCIRCETISIHAIMLSTMIMMMIMVWVVVLMLPSKHISMANAICCLHVESNTFSFRTGFVLIPTQLPPHVYKLFLFFNVLIPIVSRTRA